MFNAKTESTNSLHHQIEREKERPSAVYTKIASTLLERKSFYHRKYSFRPILVVRSLSKNGHCGKVICQDPLI